MTSATGKPLHICLINLRAYPLFNPEVSATIGGAEVDLYLIATELAKDDSFKVSFVTGDFGQAAQEVIDNVTVIKSIDVQGSFFLGARKLWHALHEADADIYFDECAGLRTWLDAAFCRRRHRPYIFRSAATEECDGTYMRKNPFRGRAFLCGVRSAAQVITQNHSDREKLLKTAGIESVVIRNSAHLPQRHGEARRTVLWVGRSATVKGPARFVQLAREMPSMHFTMICQPAVDDPLFATLSSAAAAIPNLTFVPGVSFKEIDRHFQSAIVLVNTSDSEGFPNVFVQAAKCGTPMLSLNVNPDDFLTRHKCGMCAGGDWQKFKEMLTRLVEPSMNRLYGDNAYKYARQNHDITTIIEAYKEIFRRVANSWTR
jgi:glycosyltransferase involved in cell wall biosynthesis